MNQEMKPNVTPPSRLTPQEEIRRRYYIHAAGAAWIFLLVTYIGLAIHWLTCPL